jgi:signal transduction histidine kinase
MEAQTAGDNLYYLVLIGTAGGLLLALSLILFYIRYQRKFIGQQAAMQKAELEHKQLLLNSIIRSQEEERIRISKELHDHVGSSLAGIRLLVSRLKGADADAVSNIATETRSGIDKVIEDVRSISHNLSPAGLELWGFNEALEEYSHKTGRAAGIAIEMNDAADGRMNDLCFDDALSVFRVMQELVNNTIKHAQAARITIDIRQAGAGVEITYTDDGKGIDKEKNTHGIGMYNIESRLSTIGATCSVPPPVDKGYKMLISIPATALNKKP